MQRFDLIPANAMAGIARVFNQGLDEGHKEEGWKHADVKFLLNKLKEKLNEFERMRDLDDDSLYNIDKVAAYAMMLHDVIATNPQNDNRFDVVSKIPRVALDVDDVVADFLGGYREATGDTTNPYWSSSYKIRENLEILKEDKDFWVNLKVLHRPNFEPVCYISSRSIPVEWTQEFIQKNGLPCAPVYHVPWNESKVEFLIKNHIDVLVDDKIANFQEAMRAGVFCYLMNAPHNEWFDAKNRRIYNLELFQ
jgi:hypothetical protein